MTEQELKEQVNIRITAWGAPNQYDVVDYIVEGLMDGAEGMYLYHNERNCSLAVRDTDRSGYERDDLCVIGFFINGDVLETVDY